MQTSPAVDAARRFLDLVWNGEPPSDQELLASLDRLIATYHDAPDSSISDTDWEAPRFSYPSLYKDLGSRFPTYGLYPVSDTDASPGDPDAAMVGDAIDDLADLTSDMRHVVWLADHVGLDDAHWSFRLYYFHWGKHARELALFLHSRQFG